MDLVIVVVPSPARAASWRARLPGAVVVVEDWPGGAGNGLGTLHALRQVGAESVLARLGAGEAVAVYHTAGRGTRLAPLPLAEGGDKAAVRLPGGTLLEAVLRQTAPYAPSRRGRLSVFWGDQLFLPTSYAHAPRHHVDLLARLGDSPDPRYGAVLVGEDEEARLYEKVVPPAGATGRSGRSLGCFSLSAPMLAALLDLFAPELDARRGRLDSDPDWWMPWTLPEEDYVALGGDRAHHRRLRALDPGGGLGRLGVVDVGRDAPWWDLGSLRTWRDHLLGGDRRLYGLLGATPGGNVIVDVEADRVEAEEAVLIGVRARSIRCEGGVAYHVEADDLVLGPGEVRVDVVLDGRRIPLRTTLDRDGGADWHHVLPENDLSYAEVHAAVTGRC